MILTDLNDDVLGVVVENIRNTTDVVSLACTSQRLKQLTSHDLIRRRYQTITVTIDSLSCPRHPIRHLLQLIQNPTAARYARSITISVDIYKYLMFQKPDCATIHHEISKILHQNDKIDPRTLILLHAIDVGLKEFTNGSESVQLCQVAIRAMFWICPNLKELKLKSGEFVAEQMDDLGTRTNMALSDTDNELQLNNSFNTPLEITQLKVAYLNRCLLDELPGGYNLLSTKSLRYLKIRELDLDDWREKYFWPPSSSHRCEAETIIMDYAYTIPSPLVLADLLRRCASLRRFELRRSAADFDRQNTVSFTNQCDAMANETLQQILVLNVWNLRGYASLLQHCLSNLFFERGWTIKCFASCRRSTHKQVSCLCVSILIEKP